MIMMTKTQASRPRFLGACAVARSALREMARDGNGVAYAKPAAQVRAWPAGALPGRQRSHAIEHVFYYRSMRLSGQNFIRSTAPWLIERGA